LRAATKKDICPDRGPISHLWANGMAPFDQS
jgi:hypothetical protein